tara:strand:- start:250 stop:432 length:183 start_codon:yes stop_codon:yes gene_type:complete
MDKETLIRLAQPASTLLLAVSILLIPLIARAKSVTLSDAISQTAGMGYVLKVYDVNSCKY